MAPIKPQLPNHVIEKTAEYHEFIKKLTAYHIERGTTDIYEPEPKVGTTHVDLLRTYKLIMENGGYDKVSDEKLMWRKMASILGLFSHNEASTAFNLKTVFYRNLAAYEITTFHGKVPPPPRILEYTTAKGGSLLTRTEENYKVRESNVGTESRTETPTRERPAEATPASGERSARFLRQNPAQRVPFQPDTHAARPARSVSGQQVPAPAGSVASAPNQTPNMHGPHATPPVQTPIPLPIPRGASSSWNPPNQENVSHLVQAFEPKPPVVMPLRAVDTPGNNPIEFARRQRILRAHLAGTNLAARSVMPGTGFDGPSIYIRCLCALRSSSLEEQSFALNHLVKISYERGDKYKFDSFAGLADGLVEKALGVGSLFYDVNWWISYTGDFEETNDINCLDAINGTVDILERIDSLKLQNVQDSVQSPAFRLSLLQVEEATLTIRNMVMLPDNAIYMAEYLPLKDLLVIILRLPSDESVVELKHFALDIAEQVTPFLALDSDDPLYRTLLEQLESNDRGSILTALRAVARISVNLASTNKLGDIPDQTLRTIMNLLYLNDDELLDACLDFLYMYTAVAANVGTLVQSFEPNNLVSQLVRLLAHNARRVHKELVVEKERRLPPSELQVVTPPDIVDRLVALDEPERCHSWIRCVFEEDPDATITQIAVWQSYQNAFALVLARLGKQAMNAAEFIRGINQVYLSATAKILRDGDQQKFIIQGLRARERPIDSSGSEYWSCAWRTGPGTGPGSRCGHWFPAAEEVWRHVLTAHLGAKPAAAAAADDSSADAMAVDDAGSGTAASFANAEGEYRCEWTGCRKYARPTRMPFSEFARHINTNHIRPGHGKSSASSSSSANGATPNGGSVNGGGPALTPSRRSTGGGLGSSSAGGAATGPGSAGGRSRWVLPARTISISYEETAVVRDERNPNGPVQPAGIPFSAVLVLKNIARNAPKASEPDAAAQQDQDAAAKDGWKEKLFRPVAPRLFEIMVQNRVLSPYITSLVDFADDE